MIGWWRDGAAAPRRPNRRRRSSRRSAPAPRRRLLPRLPSVLQLLLAGLVGYACYQLHFLIFQASYFKIKEIEVVGADKVGEETVLRYSGLQLGMLAFTMDPSEVERRVGLIARVAACRVRQPTPNEVVLRVEEKPVVARLVLDGRIREVGPEGELMGDAEPESQTPLLLDAEVREGPPMHLVERHLERMKEWFPILREPPTQSFSRVRFGGGGRLDVYWRGIRLVVDDVQRFVQHRRFLGPLLADARERGRGFEYVDMRFQDVVVRYAPLRTGHSPASMEAPIPTLAPELVAAGARNQQNGNQVPGAPASELDEFMNRAAAVYAAEPPTGDREAGYDL